MDDLRVLVVDARRAIDRDTRIVLEGLRGEETVAELRQARRARINGVVGKGKTQRDVFLSLDARQT